MINSKKVVSCTELFKTMESLPFNPKHIFSLLLYVVNNKHLFTKNLEIYNKDVNSDNIFHLHFINFTKYEKAAHYEGIKIFNHLPTHTKFVANEK
jgi:hypothetical protein